MPSTCTRPSFRPPTVVGRLVLGVMLGSLAFSAWACGDATRTPDHSPLNHTVPIAHCDQYSYASCDVTDSRCQERVFELVKCLRDTPNGTLPPLLTITAADYRSQLTQGASDVDTSKTRPWEIALVLLGLLSSGDLTVSKQVDVLVDTVAAFYSPEAKTVVVIEPDAAKATDSPKEDTLTLAHELVHALQDQSIDLVAFIAEHGETEDAELAGRAVVEGEALLYESFLRAAFSGLSQESVHYTDHFTNAAKLSLEHYRSQPPYLIAGRTFPYYYGARYDYLVLMQGGRAAIEAMYTRPPTTTLPFIMSKDRIVDPPTSPILDGALRPREGASLWAENTLGPWLTYLYLSTVWNTPLEATQAVGGWRGDRLYLYGDGNAENLALIWRVRWSSPDEASSFAIQTNRIARAFAGLDSPSREAFAVGMDAFVIATAGRFDPQTWQTAAQIDLWDGFVTDAGSPDSTASVSRADGGVSNIEAGTSAAKASTVSNTDAGIAAPPARARVLLTPVPRVLRPL